MVRKKKKTIKLKDFWLNFWGLFKNFSTSIKKGFALILFAELVHLLDPFLLKVVIDRLSTFEESDLWWVVGAIVALFVFRRFSSLVTFFKDKLYFEITTGAEREFMIKAQKKMVSLSLSYHEREDTGNKIIKIDKGVQKIIQLFESVFWEVVPVLTKLIVVGGILFWTDYRLGLSFIIFAPAFIFLSFKVNRKVRPVRKKRYKKYEEAAGLMTQSIININTVKSFVRENWEVSQATKIRNNIRKLGLFEWDKILRSGLLRLLISDLGKSSIILLGVFLVWNGQITTGTLIFIFMISNEAYNHLYRLSRFYDQAEEGMVAVERYMNLMQEEQEIINKKGGKKPKNLLGNIEFENVDFSYKDAKGWALKNVSAKIDAGTMTALVGPSGGGKTTFARMIYRHYDPQNGVVRIDEGDLRDFDLYSFRKFIAIVPQEVEIFSTDIKSNISYANPKASLAQVKKAAKVANADEFINKLSDKYNTKVGERGVKLSGGQRQRIGIARAILANPKILIFDEATSSLDSESERLIQDSMDNISQGRTVIVIAHRLSTIKKADKILVLEKGKLVEEGSHKELSTQKSGLYARLLKLQKMGDVD